MPEKRPLHQVIQVYRGDLKFVLDLHWHRWILPGYMYHTLINLKTFSVLDHSPTISRQRKDDVEIRNRCDLRVVRRDDIQIPDSESSHCQINGLRIP